MKVPFQVRSPLLCDLMCQKASTLPTQAEVLTPQVWKHLIDLCSREASGRTGLQLSAALVVRYVVSGLRYQHTARATFAADLSSPRTLVWKVVKGKDGQPFAISLPTHILPNWPVIKHTNSELLRLVGTIETFMPDCFFSSQEEVVIDPRPSPYYRFQAFFRSLLMLAPLALSETAASNFSTYSMRRFLPTIADALQLPDSERICLGNWQDGARLPLSVRYSSERLETAAGVVPSCHCASSAKCWRPHMVACVFVQWCHTSASCVGELSLLMCGGLGLKQFHLPAPPQNVSVAQIPAPNRCPQMILGNLSHQWKLRIFILCALDMGCGMSPKNMAPTSRLAAPRLFKHMGFDGLEVTLKHWRILVGFVVRAFSAFPSSWECRS